MTLEDVLRAPLPDRVDGVAERLHSIERSLRSGTACARSRASTGQSPRNVTRASGPSPSPHAPFVRWLDVVFANLFLRALRAQVLRPKRRPRARAPLFEARARPGVAPTQFALAWMNAHVNRDLPLALLATCRARRVVPVRGGLQHADVRRVDLAETKARARAEFATGLAGRADEALARATAWTNAETLWALRALTAGRFALTLDRTVAFAGHGLLRPVG